MAFRMLTTIDLFSFIIVFIEIAFGSWSGYIWLHTTQFWRSVTTLHNFGGALGQPLDTFFWALTISWSQLLALVWSVTRMFLPNMQAYFTWLITRMLVWYIRYVGVIRFVLFHVLQLLQTSLTSPVRKLKKIKIITLVLQ
jgi:hypothetical protein